jgi:hypothetical protein
MNRPQVVYFLSGPPVYFPSGARSVDDWRGVDLGLGEVGREIEGAAHERANGPALMALDVGQGSKPVVFHFVQEVRMINRLRNAQQPHR